MISKLMIGLSMVFTLLLQGVQTIPVTIQVRQIDGSGFTQAIIVRDDEGEELLRCVPDVTGSCQLALSRGLYLIDPISAKLDAVSSVAATEIGGQWLGITVGDAAIEYRFVIEDGAVYFDAATTAALPRPIRPTTADIDAHFSDGDVSMILDTTPVSATTATPVVAEPIAPIGQWQWGWLFFGLIGGCVMSGMWWATTRGMRQVSNHHRGKNQ